MLVESKVVDIVNSVNKLKDLTNTDRYVFVRIYAYKKAKF